MLTLLLTAILTVFLLGPDLVSRTIIGLRILRRNTAQSRGEDIARASLWAVIPLCLALLWCRFAHVYSRWGGDPAVVQTMKGLYSTAYFDRNPDAVLLSLRNVGGMLFSLWWRTYAFVIVFAVALNLAIGHYRWLRERTHGERWKERLADLILPRLSEWYVLLSGMLLPADDVVLKVDVLTKSGTMYQGRVQDHVLATDGSIQTLTLADVGRFKRDEFIESRKERGPGVRSEDFWRPIPGKLFVLLGGDIANINVRHEPTPKVGLAINAGSISPKDKQTARALIDKLEKRVPT